MPYAVTQGLPGGYMPDTCDHYRTKREAEQGAKFWADVYRKDWDVKYRVEGSMRSGRYDVYDDSKTCDHVAVIEVNKIGWEDFEEEE